MGGLPSTVTNESVFRIAVPAKNSCHIPESNMIEAVTRDMASSDWLKLEALSRILGMIRAPFFRQGI